MCRTDARFRLPPAAVLPGSRHVRPLLSDTRALGVARRAGHALGALLLLGSTGGCGAFGVAEEVEQSGTADARVASDIKRALISVDGVDAAAVRVVAKEKRVTLDGFVASEAEREATLEAARGALGGYELVDELEVHR